MKSTRLQKRLDATQDLRRCGNPRHTPEGEQRRARRSDFGTRLRHHPRTAPSFRVSQRRTAPHQRKARNFRQTAPEFSGAVTPAGTPRVAPWAMRKKGRSKNESATLRRRNLPVAALAGAGHHGVSRPALAPARLLSGVGARGVSHAVNQGLTARCAAAGVTALARSAQRRPRKAPQFPARDARSGAAPQPECASAPLRPQTACRQQGRAFFLPPPHPGIPSSFTSVLTGKPGNFRCARRTSMRLGAKNAPGATEHPARAHRNFPGL
jgi:hypothetical protein